MATDGAFGLRLRRERERRQISLASIAETTKISQALLEGLERGDVSRWPSGIFRRAFIRTYAASIGLDADATSREFLELYPDPLDPPATQSVETPAPPPVEPAFRLTLADMGKSFVKGRVLSPMRSRWAAAACDTGVVVAVALSVFVACGRFWLPLGVTMLGYYVGGILVLGNTPGVCLWAPEPDQRKPRSTVVTTRGGAAKSALALLGRFIGSMPDA